MSSRKLPTQGTSTWEDYQRRPTAVRFADQWNADQPKPTMRPCLAVFAPSLPNHWESADYRGSSFQESGLGSIMREQEHHRNDSPHEMVRPNDRELAHGQSQSVQVQNPELQQKAKPGIEVVDVPEHHVFFTSSVATRQSILDKLNLNSLFEYIEYLDKYRLENQDMISSYYKFYISILKDEKMRDPDKGIEDQDLASAQENSTAKVSLQIESIEKCLEEYQVKKVAATSYESCLVKDPEKSADDSFEEIQCSPPPSRKPTGNKMRKNIQVVDLTFRENFSKLKANLPAATPKAKSKFLMRQEPDDHDLDDSITITVDPTKGPVDTERGGGLMELQAKLLEMHALQLAAKQKQSSHKPSASLMDFTSSKMKDVATMLETTPAEGVILSEGSNSNVKLDIDGYEVPLPNEFNQLSLVQKNAIMRQLPDAIRGQYLAMIWEARFYEHLAANTAIDPNDQSMLTFNL